MELHFKGSWPPCRVPGDCGADHVPVLPGDQRHPCGDDALRVQGPLGLAAHVPRDPAGAPLVRLPLDSCPYHNGQLVAAFTAYAWRKVLMLAGLGNDVRVMCLHEPLGLAIDSCNGP